MRSRLLPARFSSAAAANRSAPPYLAALSWPPSFSPLRRFLSRLKQQRQVNFAAARTLPSQRSPLPPPPLLCLQPRQPTPFCLPFSRSEHATRSPGNTSCADRYIAPPRLLHLPEASFWRGSVPFLKRPRERSKCSKGGKGRERFFLVLIPWFMAREEEECFRTHSLHRTYLGFGLVLFQPSRAIYLTHTFKGCLKKGNNSIVSLHSLVLKTGRVIKAKCALL